MTAEAGPGFALPPLPPLPIDDVIPDCIAALRQHRAAVLTALPGAGKTTRIPLALLRCGLLAAGRLVMLQPRRVAARVCAGHMAGLLGESVGATVGYQVRFDRRIGRDTRIEVVTEGILTRRFADDPLLEGIACVVLDEFHERSTDGDLALAFVKETMRARDDLCVLVMSATMNTDEVSAYLGGCPVVTGAGRPFPVTVEYLPQLGDGPLAARTAQTVVRVLREVPEGDVLVFLPGAGEIERTARRLRARTDVEVVRLYGALSAPQQDLALRPGERRRVILSTNIAETSLTLRGVRVVVDSGLVKRVEWTPTGLDRLVTGRASQYSLTQRAGRAGREAPGRVFRMWAPQYDRQHPTADEPEIRRMDPMSYLLSILSFAPGDPKAFALLTPPVPSNVDRAIELLRMMGAIEADGFVLTALGRQLAGLPLHPRIGAVLVAAARCGALETGAMVAALLSTRDVLRADGDGQSGFAPLVDCDVAFRVERMQQFVQEGADAVAADALGLGYATAVEVLRLKRSLQQMVNGCGAAERETNFLLAGFFDRVCQKDGVHDSVGRMAGGGGVVITGRTGVRESRWFLVLDARAGKKGACSRAEVTLASEIGERDLERQFPLLMKTSEQMRVTSSGVEGIRERRFLDLVLSRERVDSSSPEAVTLALQDYVRQHWSEVFVPDEKTRALMDRVAFAASVSPAYAWPDVSADGVLSMVLDLCTGCRSVELLRAISWEREVRQRLPSHLKSILELQFPEYIVLPGGARAPVRYGPGLQEGRTPMISVRLQQLFGMQKTPRIADGRIALTIEILSPARRPVQITRDLESFWRHGYAQVRKELRARYVRHNWPEDPHGMPVASSKKKS